MPILLKFDTEIKGDSMTDQHEGWISCSSVEFEVARDVHSSGAGADRNLGNPDCKQVKIRKSSDIASPNLMLQAFCGKSLGPATIHFVRVGGADDPPEVFTEWILTNAIVTSYEQDARDDAGNVHPDETIKLNFTEVELNYVQFSGGEVVADDTKGFDLLKNKPKS